MDLIDILFSKALLKSSGGGEINNDVATKEFVNAAIDAIKNGVSEEYDTLKEIEDTLTTKLTNSPTEWPTWTVEEQATAKEKIGFTDNISNVVRYDTVQTLSDEQRAQARENISAASTEDFAQFKSELVTNKNSATENTRFAIGTAEESLEVPSMEEYNAVKDDLSYKIDKPTASDNNKFPRAKDGNVEWVEQGLPTDAQTANAVTNWLNEHPEATTTVQDGTITKNKLDDDIRNRLSISPDDFEGTDAEKLQSAIDHAIQNHLSVKVSRIYDITGNTILINKSRTAFSNDREMLYIFGSGGGIKKTDSGFIFSAPYSDIGDITIQNIKFIGATGAGTIVYDCDKLIRLRSISNSYVNVDTIASAPNRYFQSMQFLNESYTGGKGWKFEAAYFIDTVISGCLCEYAESFIRNYNYKENNVNANLRIINNIVEDLSGSITYLTATMGLICGNYFEGCGNYVNLSAEGCILPHTGLSVCNNSFSLDVDQISNTPCITWGLLPGYNTFGKCGVISFGNSTNGILHYCNIENKEGVLVTLGESFKTLVAGNSKNIHYLGKIARKTGENGSVLRVFGGITYIDCHANASLPVGLSTVSIPIDYKASIDSAITVWCNTGGNFVIKNWYFESGAVKINVDNTGSTTLNRTFYARIMIFDVPNDLGIALT